MIKQERKFTLGVLTGAIFALVIIVTFFLGIWIGRSNEKFIPHWGRNWQSRSVFTQTSNHEVVGLIDSLANNSLIIKQKNNELRTIIVDQKTKIRNTQQSLIFQDLKKGDQIIVLGDPQAEDKALLAKFIRVL